MSTPTLLHVDYPHWPGALPDCPACEAECFCEGSGNCVHCHSANWTEAYGEWLEETFDPDAEPWDTLEEMNGHA